MLPPLDLLQYKSQYDNHLFAANRKCQPVRRTVSFIGKYTDDDGLDMGLVARKPGGLRGLRQSKTQTNLLIFRD